MTTVERDTDVMPRRRRTGCCACLRMDGEPVTYESMAEQGVRINPTSAGYSGGLQKHIWTCPEGRPTVEMDPAWVIDICASSWHRDCEYKPAPKPVPPPPPPRPLPRYESDDPLDRSPMSKAARQALANRIRAALTARGIALPAVSQAFDQSPSWASSVLGEQRPSGLRRIANWLIQQQGRRAA